MSDSIAYYNGEFKPADQISITLVDAGFVWGATVTDRTRTFGGRLFRLTEHLERFRESCRFARISLPESDEELRITSERLVAENRDTHELSLIWLATPGSMTSADRRIPTRIAYSQPLLPHTHSRLLQDGATLVTIPASLGVDPVIKHRSRLAWWIAQESVRETSPEAEPLFVDTQSDAILETPTANLFLVRDGTVLAPEPGTVLEGVSLKVVTELCVSIGLPVERRRIPLAELAHASEAILANSTYCLAGVSRVNEHTFGQPGPVLERLRIAWQELVGANLFS